eukprot:gene17869-18098_t
MLSTGKPLTAPLCMIDFGYRDGEYRFALTGEGMTGGENMEAEIAAIRKALKRIDHSDTTERKIGLDAEAALDRIEKPTRGRVACTRALYVPFGHERTDASASKMLSGAKVFAGPTSEIWQWRDFVVYPFADVMPSATPTEAELAAWATLPRDEQLRRLRAVLTHPDATTPSNATMSDILVRAHARSDAKPRNGVHVDSEEQFGRYQADAYLAGLDRTFGLLADFPLMGPSADELVPKLRRFRFQSHFIFYMVEPDHIFIRGIFHVRMNIRPDLFE